MNEKFDPNATLGASDGIFGLPIGIEEAQLVIIPLPWEVTTSYGGGTSAGPQAIRQASVQLDLYDPDFTTAYEKGIYMVPAEEEVRRKNALLKPIAEKVIYQREHHGSLDHQDEEGLAQINKGSLWVQDWLCQKAKELLAQNKLIGVLGGDHSVPLGAYQAMSEYYQGDYGLLQIDAHADLRKSYQGFTQSHASIMRNLMDSDFAPKQLVQVGIRDFCPEEKNYISNHSDRVTAYFDRHLKDRLFQGSPWAELAKEIVGSLPQNVHLSLDVDGLSPEFCPHTGTPVPGGLSFDQVVYLIKEMHRQQKKIISFDLCEVCPGPNQEYDANVGARLLYQLCGWTLVTMGRHKI